MYVKVAAVSNDDKVSYFSKLESEDNLKLCLFAEYISSSTTEITQNK